MKTPILESKRVILRPLTVADAKTAFNNWTSDDKVTKYMRYNSHTSIDDTIGWLRFVEEAENSDKQYDWGFIDKKAGTLFGSGGLVWNDDEQMYEIGYNCMFDYWHKGFTTEIAAVILNFAKNALKQTKIYGCHAVENVNSGKVMIKNGFVPTGYTTVTNFDGTTKKARTYILNF